ncbi:hypothetical protein ACQ0MK_10495 [Thalassospira lucentensis]|uniref:hypothetical protein n=1 Tax=Thalassospira lucentensis TaxID=168935 RepID=UPI003D2F0B65
MNNIANYDISTMVLRPDGVEGFYWPIRNDELVILRDHFLQGLTEFVHGNSLSQEEKEMVICFFSIVGEVSKVWKTQTLIRRAESDGKTPVFPSVAAFSNALNCGQKFHSNSVHQLLVKGLPEQPEWKQWLRCFRSMWKREPLPQSCLSFVDLKQDTVSIATGQTIRLHAEKTDEPVKYLPLRYWFSPLTAQELNFDNARYKDIAESIVNIASKSFEETGEALSETGRDYLLWWLCQVYAYGQGYLNRISRKPDTIPLKLWRGTGGLFWGRLLSIATRRAGGTVTGHDHSHGQGAWKSSSDSLVEYPFCDEFYVHTDLQVEMSKRNLREEYCFPVVPVLKSLAPSVSVNKGYNKYTKRNPSPRKVLSEIKHPKIMYVATLYNPEMVNFSPLVPMQIMVDWEARLFAKFVSWGWRVIYKPHPESSIMPSNVLWEHPMITLENRRFESVCNDCDMLWFAQSNSSSFLHALYSDKPITIANTDHNPWHEEAKNLVEKRCVLASIDMDESGRFMTDWHRLRQEIEDSFSRTGNLFRDAFFLR